MCFSIATKRATQLERYRHWNKLNQPNRKIEDADLVDYNYVSAFDHPKIAIYTDAAPFVPVESTWGLIPSWSKDRSISNKTLNARGETIFEKPAFRESAQAKRCLLYVDGFFEYHHHKSKTYPYFIFQKDETAMILAGLWNDWANPLSGEIENTFSIVTTTANPMMAKIHNNPKLAGPRMPLILPADSADDWLQPIRNDSDLQLIQSLISPYSQEKMDSYTVGALSGKSALGNVPEVLKRVNYEALNPSQLGLF